MFKKFMCSVAALGALALVTQSDAKAATIFGFYSTDGGATINPLGDLDPTATGFTYLSSIQGALGNFGVDIVTGLVQPSAGTALLTSNSTNSHSALTTDTLSIYLLGTGLVPGGPQTFTSGFTSNAVFGSGLTVTERTYLGTPFAPGTLLGLAAFPPLVGSATSVASASVPAGYSLTAQYDITATGVVNSNATIQVSAVPGPIVGAGLPGLVAACGGLLALARRRRKQAV